MSRKIGMLICLICLCSKISSTSIVIVGINGSEEIVEVDDNESILMLSQTIPIIKTIHGLEDLRNLKHLIITFSDMSKADDSVWESMKQIEVLQLKFITLKDFHFLTYLPNLVAFSLQEGIEVHNSSPINLTKNTKIEYFEIHGLRITFFPSFLGYPNSLKTISFYGTEIEQLVKDDIFKGYHNGQTLILNDKDIYNIGYVDGVRLGTKDMLLDIWEKYDIE